ncbi:MAG: hypothetical protein JNL82_30470 [Myxococcales bacterium]|nr:hypothetical protein [Myxococcales bacterium]
MRLRPSSLLFVLSACGPGTGDSRGDTGVATATTTAASADTTATATTSASTPTTGIASAASSEGDGDATAVAASTGGSTGASTGGDDTSTTLATTGAVDPVTTTGMKLDLPPEQPIPVHEIPGLKSITFYETTGMVTEYTFLVDGPELNTPLADPLSTENRDIQGTSVEFYDVYYSDVDGNFDMNGSYLTIAGSFGAKLPAGGGLNLAEISLNYDDDSVEYGSFLASFLGLGDNYVPGSEPNAIDGDLMTHTTMGNNVDEPGKRLRVTLGFKSSLMPG